MNCKTLLKQGMEQNFQLRALGPSSLLAQGPECNPRLLLPTSNCSLQIAFSIQKQAVALRAWGERVQLPTRDQNLSFPTPNIWKIFLKFVYDTCTEAMLISVSIRFWQGVCCHSLHNLQNLQKPHNLLGNTKCDQNTW